MINFFTICFNAQPFIQYHLPIFETLKIPWRWVIVEGLSRHGSDRGGRQPDLSGLHINYRSIDGASEYLESIKDERVKLIRRPQIWNGKTDMCNAALEAMPDGDLLWEVDCDENWTVPQIEKCALLFDRFLFKQSALFCCRVWVGPDRYIFTPGMSGNHLEYEWRRVWRFRSDWRFKTHEPPVYGHVRTGVNPGDLTHAETMDAGLVFNHLAYVNESQVAFKSRYYGWPKLLDGWRRLQSAALPCKLRDFMPEWCDDDVLVVGRLP